jgi:hypothetical protein
MLTKRLVSATFATLPRLCEQPRQASYGERGHASQCAADG